MSLDVSTLRKAHFARILPVLLLAVGCNAKDAEKCGSALSTARQAISAENFAQARQWREYAYKQCDDQGALGGLDKELSEREAAATAAKEAEAKKAQETAQLMKVFGEFVTQNRAAPDRASAAPVCEAPAAGAAPAKPGEESKDRFCSASRAVGSYSIQVRFWQADPSAFRFSVRPEGVVGCDALGPATVAKSWDVAAVGGKTVKRHSCDLGGPLSGLHGVVSEAAKAEVSVFSPQYLDRDPGMKPILSGP